MKIKWNRIKDTLEKIAIVAGIIVWASVYLGIIYLFTIAVSPEEIDILVIPFFFAWSIIWGFVAMPFCTHFEKKKKIPSRSF